MSFLLVIRRDRDAFLFSYVKLLTPFAFLYQTKIRGILFLSFKYAFHFVWIQLHFEIDRLEEVHVTEAIFITSNQLALVAIDLALLFFQYFEPVIKALPVSLVDLFDFFESI